MQDVQVIDVVTGIAQTSAQALVAIAFKVLLSLLVLVIVKLVNRTIDRLLTKASQKVHPKISPLMAGFIDKVLSSVVWLLGILIVLQIWGINMAPVIAGLGITGVVLGFALQESISNIFSGRLLALNNPFGIGDYVIIGSIEGTVVSMDAFSVTLATGDRKKITMANKLVLADPIINVSSSDDRRLDMTVSVAYGSDLDRVKGIITDLLESYPEVLRDPVPVVEVSKLNSSSVDFIVRPWVHNSDYWKVNWRFQKDIYDLLNREGIEIPYSKLDVNIRNS